MASGNLVQHSRLDQHLERLSIGRPGVAIIQSGVLGEVVAKGVENLRLDSKGFDPGALVPIHLNAFRHPAWG